VQEVLARLVVCCWFHKIANVLNNFPKSMQHAVTADLHVYRGTDLRQRFALVTPPL